MREGIGQFPGIAWWDGLCLSEGFKDRNEAIRIMAPDHSVSAGIWCIGVQRGGGQDDGFRFDIATAEKFDAVKIAKCPYRQFLKSPELVPIMSAPAFWVQLLCGFLQFNEGAGRPAWSGESQIRATKAGLRIFRQQSWRCREASAQDVFDQRSEARGDQ